MKYYVRTLLLWLWSLIKEDVLDCIRVEASYSFDKGADKWAQTISTRIAHALNPSIPEPITLYSLTHDCGHTSPSWSTDQLTGKRVCIDCHNRAVGTSNNGRRRRKEQPIPITVVPKPVIDKDDFLRTRPPLSVGPYTS